MKGEEGGKSSTGEGEVRTSKRTNQEMHDNRRFRKRFTDHRRGLAGTVGWRKAWRCRGVSRTKGTTEWALRLETLVECRAVPGRYGLKHWQEWHVASQGRETVV